MLRLFLGTLFLFSLSFPFIAEFLLMRSRRPAPVEQPYYGRYNPPPVEYSLLDFSAHSAITLSVIYPGLIVLMTMAAYFFLRLMEPAARHDHKAFLRTSLALSAIWVCGFYPFLSSALGGVLFCASAMGCIGAWLIIRRLGVALHPFQRVAVFWAFFFFSVILSLLATGNGARMAEVFSRALGALQSGAEQAVPLLLVALHGAAVLAVMHLMGWRLKPGASPQTVMALKIAAITGGLLLLDFLVMGIRYDNRTEWVILPLLALPSLAYYGVYWLVMRLPEQLRGRVTFAMFAALSVLLAVLACVQSGVSGAVMVSGAAAFGITAAIGGGMYLLWKSDAEQATKLSLTIVFGLFLLCLAMLARG